MGALGEGGVAGLYKLNTVDPPYCSLKNRPGFNPWSL
jgi:hypothetical protein